jgi:hypothetical protein
LNWTPATESLSLALALTATLPLTVVPPTGAVIDTVGGVVSQAFVLAVSVALPAETLPEVSTASTARLWLVPQPRPVKVKLVVVLVPTLVAPS